MAYPPSSVWVCGLVMAPNNVAPTPITTTRMVILFPKAADSDLDAFFLRWQ